MDKSNTSTNLFQLEIFLGGNNLYNGTDDSEADIEEIANDLVELANKFTTVAKKVFVIGIPPRGEIFARAQSLDDLLKQKTDVSWKFRSSNHYLKSEKCRKIGDEVHLNENGINNLKNLLKDNKHSLQILRPRVTTKR